MNGGQRSWAPQVVEDSNLRQHDGVGAENGLQRLSEESGGDGRILGVSANLVASKTPRNGPLLAVSGACSKWARLAGGVHQTRTSDNNDACNRCGQDSNHRQHDAVGAEIGLQRLFAQSRGNDLISGVSANTPARKVPTNGHLLRVSPGDAKRGGLGGGAGRQSLTRLCRTFPVFQGINRDIAGGMPISRLYPLQKCRFFASP